MKGDDFKKLGLGDFHVVLGAPEWWKEVEKSAIFMAFSAFGVWGPARLAPPTSDLYVKAGEAPAPGYALLHWVYDDSVEWVKFESVNDEDGRVHQNMRHPDEITVHEWMEMRRQIKKSYPKLLSKWDQHVRDLRLFCTCSVRYNPDLVQCCPEGELAHAEDVVPCEKCQPKDKKGTTDDSTDDEDPVALEVRYGGHSPAVAASPCAAVAEVTDDESDGDIFTKEESAKSKK